MHDDTKPSIAEEQYIMLFELSSDDWLKDSGEAELASEIAVALAATETQYVAIDTQARAGSPFDVQIMEENAEVSSAAAQAIIALNAQSALIADIAEKAGIDGSVVVDPEVTRPETTRPPRTGSLILM